MKHTFEPCFALSVRKADRVISQIYTDYLSPLGLKSTQFTLLRVLYLLGETTAGRLQEVLVMEQATVSRALKPLIRDGFVLTLEGEDKREKRLRLSPEGKALFKQGEVLWQQAQQHIREHLGDQAETMLLDLHEKIVSLKRE